MKTGAGARGGRCPVTGGLATRMGEAGFAAICRRKRKADADLKRHSCRGGEAASAHTYEYMRCLWCKGAPENRPPELTIINLEEIEMGKKQLGSCDLCGEKKELKHTERGGGLDVCSNCWKTFTVADRTDILVRAIRLLGKEAEVAAALGAEPTAPDPARERYELWMGETLRILGGVLPAEDEGLDDTRSFADIVDLAERARLKITTQAAELHTLRDIIKPASNETSIRAATEQVKAARAWAALMDRARDSGFSDIADGDPVVMAGTYIMAVDEVMAERDRLKAELADARAELAGESSRLRALGELLEPLQTDETETAFDTLRRVLAERDDEAPKTVATTEENAKDVALLRWARGQVDAGRIGFHIEVREMAA